MYHLSIIEVDMPYWKKMYVEMTSAERRDRIVEIVTKASLRLLKKKQAEAAGHGTETPWEKLQKFNAAAAAARGEKAFFEIWGG
ncbi:MAG: hypothetical protein A2X31_01710 [Elusimicrobia bacterium GWB2_63_22]|nr:MAG: hypothetical protein A2X31_01710 [Elusimicrobia bacterium GWB2_63_22]